MWELDNVTISNGTDVVPATWGITNKTLSITDGSNNSMVLFYWPTSYSVENANLFAQTVPSGPVNIMGFVSNFGSTAEFTPMSITPVPEPSSIVLLAMGAVGLAWLRRRLAR